MGFWKKRRPREILSAFYPRDHCHQLLLPFAQHCTLSDAPDIIVTGLVKDIQKHRLLEDIEDPQASRIAAVSTRLCFGK